MYRLYIVNGSLRNDENTILIMLTVMLTIVSHGHNTGTKQESKSMTIVIPDSR